MFKQLLEDLLNHVDGAEAALVVDFDGLLIEQYSLSNDYHFEQLAADSSQLLKSSIAAAASLPDGSIKEIAIITNSLRVVFRILADSYFVALLLSESANLGKARFKLRKIQSDLEKELAM